MINIMICRGYAIDFDLCEVDVPKQVLVVPDIHPQVLKPLKPLSDRPDPHLPIRHVH